MPASIRSSLGSRHPRPIDDGKQRKVVVVPRADAGYCDDATLVCACCGNGPGVHTASPATLVADRPGPRPEKGDPPHEYCRCEQWPGRGRFHARRFTAVDPKHGPVFEWELD